MTERKASELLFDIISKITEMEKMLKINDFQQRTIISALNKLNKQVFNDNLENSVVSIKNNTNQNNDFEFVDSKEQIEKESTIDKKNKLMTIKKSQNDTNGNNEFGYVSQEEFEKQQQQDSQANVQYGISKRERIALSSNNPEKLQKTENLIPVMQKLLYENGEPVAYATIMIRSLTDGVPEKTVSANALGRWQAALSVGKYVARVVHMNTVLCEQAFTVPFSSSVFELAAPTIYEQPFAPKAT